MKSDSESPVSVALSIRQPWATLLVHGIKTIEIRRWSTPRIGTVYIHAGKIPDKRDHAWKLVPKYLQKFAALSGGIVGKAELVECKTYTSRASFTKDQMLHYNAPEWFLPPKMHGFVFEEAEPLPFQQEKGKLYFFRVDF